MATIFDLAHYFVKRATEEKAEMSSMKLQKLCYYAQAWTLAKLDRPLCDGEFEAWEHGPVDRKLYSEYKGRTQMPLEFIQTAARFDAMTVFDGSDLCVLEEVWEFYGGLSASALRNMTHQENPWRENFDSDSIYHQNPIPVDSMRRYYCEQKDSPMWKYERLIEEATVVTDASSLGGPASTHSDGWLDAVQKQSIRDYLNL